MPCQAKQVPDDGEELRIAAINDAAFMGFGKPVNPGQGVGRKNLTEGLKMAALCGGNS